MKSAIELVRKHERDRVFQAVVPSIQSALQNEEVTRQRVDAIEQWLMVWTHLSLLGRVKWILTGNW